MRVVHEGSRTTSDKLINVGYFGQLSVFDSVYSASPLNGPCTSRLWCAPAKAVGDESSDLILLPHFDGGAGYLHPLAPEMVASFQAQSHGPRVRQPDETP